jgi:hypothetical protein
VPLLNGANSFSAAQLLASGTAGSTVEEFWTLLRNKGGAGSANDFLEALAFAGENSTPAQKTFARIYAQIISATAGSENGAWLLDTIQSGTLSNVMKAIQGLQIGAPTGGDQGAGTLNLSTHLYRNGGRLDWLAQAPVYASFSAAASGTTLMPSTDTVPTNTQGDQYMTATFTPVNSGSAVYVDVVIHGTNSNGNSMMAALYQDSGANAIASGVWFTSASLLGCGTFHFKVTGSFTAGLATTFKIRAGSISGITPTFYFNTAAGAHFGGTTFVSSMTIWEVLP